MTLTIALLQDTAYSSCLCVFLVDRKKNLRLGLKVFAFGAALLVSSLSALHLESKPQSNERGSEGVSY